MEKISMRGVDFDHAEARLASAACRGDEGFDDLANPALIERCRMWIAIRERDCARRDRRPSTFGRRNLSRPFPRALRAALSSSMRELDSGDRALFTDEASDTCEGLDMIVLPNSEILRADPAFW